MQEFYENAVIKKLQCKTLLDLALTLPATYEDRRLATDFINGRTQTFETKVLNTIKQNQNLKITFFLPRFNQKIDATIFHPKPFHYKVFGIGKQLYISAKVGLFNGFFQLTQPKVITVIGKIEPTYKEHKIRQNSLKAVIKKYISASNLQALGLNQEEIGCLLSIHFPKEIPNFENEKTIKILKTVEIYNHLRKLQSKRHDYPALKQLRADLTPFVQKLPFELTKEQKAVIMQIKNDLSRDIAAKRMVVGDVGSGKTMMILAAAQLAYPHKTYLMAPTSILANQLYEEACKYLDFDIALLSASKTINDYKSANFVIATHALLYKKDLPPPSLVMVDEQHRFGVKQRHKLTKFTQEGKKKPHYLQFSATPIPRTQAMIDAQMVDISLITSTPFKKDINSQVIKKEDFAKLLKHIKKEIAQKHQILIIYPLVNESENFNYQSLDEGKSFWHKKFNNVYVTHGKDKEKENVLEEFKQKGDILLATTVVEVGISLPRLTTIVIVGAENMGLATLHQLRGRVSRNGLKGYCYLFTKADTSPRLEQFCKTNSGFEIARLDLKFRKSGDMVEGKAQSGNQFVWIDLSEDEEIIKNTQMRINQCRA